MALQNTFILCSGAQSHQLVDSQAGKSSPFCAVLLDFLLNAGSSLGTFTEC